LSSLSDNKEAGMNQQGLAATRAELQPLLQLTARVGGDPLLTQASAGNSSAKLDGVLWIKASGRWMANALRDDIFIPLDLAEVSECLSQGMDPAERYPCASLETAMHAVLPHAVVLHVHCVNTIAWAVRNDAPAQLQSRLAGLRWQWIPYVASGLPLSRKIGEALLESSDADVFILGNHGLVIGGTDAAAVESLLRELQGRLTLRPREAHPADYAVLLDLCQDSVWTLPEDDELHGLGTDPISRAILRGGLLYPCQAMFSGSSEADQPFLIVDGSGLLVRKSITSAELAMLSGLVQVVQRLSASAPLRYLTEVEIAGLSGQVTDRYRQLANASR
jgi:rhamnose utilization protein RhaD (predicted bifunctional aldolase and dehydrogenase)